jgi:hypothetical protein
MGDLKNIEKHKFKKGQSGNPAGREPGTLNRSTTLKKWLYTRTKLKNPITKKEEVGTIEDMIALALLKKGMEGDVPAIREALDTIYGKNKETLELDEKLTIEWKETKTYLKNDTDS